MCEPVAITTGVMAVLSAGAAIRSANQQQRALSEQMQLQQQQTDQAASAQMDDRMKAAREQRAAARAAAAESGVSGNSVQAVLNDVLMQSGRDVSRIEKNRQNGQLEIIQQTRSHSSEINGQLVTDLAGSASRGAAAGILMSSAYSDYIRKRIPKIPDAGQHAPPRITPDRQKVTIGN